MKTPEILLASAVIACVAAAATTFATKAFETGPERTSGEARAATGGGVALDARDEPETLRILTGLRMENSALQERLTALERLLSERASRTPVAALSEGSVEDSWPAGIPGNTAVASDGSIVVTPAFVASVGRALDSLEAQKEAERQALRKEMQAQRIEERVSTLQLELGLTRGQAGDLRSVLIAQDDKRDELFSGMRDGSGDPRQMRDEFKTIRDESEVALKGILTPEQFDAYRESERSDWGGFGRDRGGERGGDSGRGRGGERGGDATGGSPDGRRGGR